jgi:hypothetical protein
METSIVVVYGSIPKSEMSIRVKSGSRSHSHCDSCHIIEWNMELWGLAQDYGYCLGEG